MRIPNPAVLEVEYPLIDQITGDVAETGKEKIYLRNPGVGPADDQLVLFWNDGETIFSRAITGPLVDDGDALVTTSVHGGSYRIRALDPYDAIDLAPVPGIPQPVEVIRTYLLGGGPMAQELDAVVAPDNTVVTLMLDTNTGVYVRYSRNWQLLRNDSTSVLEDMALVAVAAGAVDIWDAADSANVTITVFDLPNQAGAGVVLSIQDPGTPEPPLSTDGEPVTAAGLSIPTISGADDLALAFSYGDTHPAARWYVSKRAISLGAEDRIPAAWSNAG
jgi:hypothetical protein